MKIKPILASLLLATGFILQDADAAISITDFDLTETSVSFNISGTIEGTLPAGTRDFLYFFNLSAPPRFSLGDSLVATSISFTGSQTLSQVSTGVSGSGDYFFLDFQDVFAAGESISGSFTATWSSPAFDPSATDSLNVYWGHNSTSAASGAFQTSVGVIPEPSAAALLAGAAAFCLASRSCKE